MALIGARTRKYGRMTKLHISFRPGSCDTTCKIVEEEKKTSGKEARKEQVLGVKVTPLNEEVPQDIHYTLGRR